jgi:hypothetical protein
VGVTAKSQLSYSQRYIARNMRSRRDFQVVGGELRIASFDVEDVRCLSSLLSIIAHLLVMVNALVALFCIMLIL